MAKSESGQLALPGTESADYVKPIVLCLPMPPTQNNAYMINTRSKGKRATRFPSTEYIEWKEKCYKVLGRIANHYPYGQPVTLIVEFWFKDKRVQDCDNRIKTLQDVLKGYAYTDDTQIYRTTFDKCFISKEKKQISQFVNVFIMPREASLIDKGLQDMMKIATVTGVVINYFAEFD